NLTYKTNVLPANLTLGSVSPTTGNQTTLLNFSVIYTEPENYPPTLINVLINGTPYVMEKLNINDNSYTDGCAYQYLTYLQPGNYNYSFECWDGKYYNRTSIYPGLTIVSTNLMEPTLTNGHVTPNEGYGNWTIFKFRVTYTDPDNNAPDFINITINSKTYFMTKLNPSDTNYMDGCIFKLDIKLDIGTYYFNFNCSDGTYIVSTELYTGPFVTKIVEGLILFDGMYYCWQMEFDMTGTPIIWAITTRYSYSGGNSYHVSENNPLTYWFFYIDSTNSRDVNNLTRVISNSENSFMSSYVFFEDDAWEPICIFNNVSMGDFVPIAMNSFFTSEKNRTFQITGEENISRFNMVLDCWKLTDVMGSIAYYEKITGLLISAYFLGDFLDYSINVTKTNVFPVVSESDSNLESLLLPPIDDSYVIVIIIILAIIVAVLIGSFGIVLHQKRKGVYISKPEESKKPRAARKASLPKMKNQKVEAWKDQGDIFRAERNYQKAYECYQRALEIDPEDVRAKVMIELLQDKISPSISQAEPPSTIIKEKIEKKPEPIIIRPSIIREETPKEKAISLFDQGFDFFKVGEYKRSISYFEKTIELYPQFKNAWYSLGVAHMNLGNFEKAIECFEKEIEIDPSNKLAKAFMNSLKKRYLKSEVEVKPSIPEIKEMPEEKAKKLYDMGKDFYNSENYLKAIEYFEKAVKLTPQLKEAWYELGLSHAALGNMEKVIESHKKVIEIDPEFKEAWKFLGTAYLSQKNYQEAILSYNKVLELDPQDTYSWYYMSKCFEKLEKYQNMIQCLVNVVSIDPMDKRAWFNLGTVYEKLGHNKEALEYYTNVYNIDPQYKQVQEKIDSLKNKI
ncbi:MAG: tetratricopeptide repeat protein, partial [Promethearchaeota archaeon]